MLRTLQLVGSMHPGSGGPPRVVAGTALALVEAGCSATIAALGPAGDDKAIGDAWPELARKAIPVRLFERDRPGVLGRSHAFNHWIKTAITDFDIVHVHGVWEGFLAEAAAAARRADRRCFVSAHGMLDDWSMAQSRLRKLSALRFTKTGAMLGNADAIIAGTPGEAAEAAAHVGEAPLRVLPNGVAVSLLDNESGDARAQLRKIAPRIARYDRLVLFFSRIHPKKGVDILLDGFSRIAEDFPDCGLLIAGIAQDEAYEAEMRQAVASSSVADRIEIRTDLTGPRYRFLYDAADIFALPSFQEGFSVAAIEAMAHGCPVLATDRCHLEEVAARDAGRIMPATPEGIARGLRDLLSLDRQGLADLGQRGRGFVEERCTWPQVADQLLAIYRGARP